MIIGLGAYLLVSQNLLAIISYLGLEEYLRVETLEEGSGRLIAWQFAWENIQDSMLIGKGFMYDLILMRTNFDWLSRAGHEGGVHNSYLILWLNTGLLGIVFFFRAFFLLFLRAAKLNAVAIPAMVAVMFSIFFEPWLAASLNPYTIVFLVVLTILSSPEINGVRLGEDGKIIREEDEEDEEDAAEGDIKWAEA